MSKASIPEDYIHAVGLATITWAILETGIDFIVAITFNGLGPPPKHTEIPRSLSNKIDYLKDAAKLDHLAPWREALLSVATKAASLKERRHDLVHGIAYNQLQSGELQMFRILYEKTIHRAPESTFTLESVAGMIEETTALAIEATNLACQLLTEFKSKLTD